MLELVTFTGVDGKTSLYELVTLSREYPKIEFGVLVGTQTFRHPGSDNGIFPSIHRVKLFKERCFIGVNTAIHLCGWYSRTVMNPAASNKDLDYISDLCRGFDRVQINLHGDFWDERYIEVKANALTKFMGKVGAIRKRSSSFVPHPRIILQHRSGWDKVPVVMNGPGVSL